MECATGDRQLSACARRRRNLYLWLGLWCALLGVSAVSGQRTRAAPQRTPSLPSSSAAPSADDDRLAQSLLQNVVRIEGQPREGSSENGFGFVVGERYGKLYIATALHVVGAPEPDGTSRPVKVTFFDDQATRRDAEIVGTHEHDLAVLRVQKPEGFSFITSCLSAAGMPRSGTPIWAIGKLTKWKLLLGRLDSDRPSSDQEIEISGLQVSPGSSGGLVVAATGIVGMVKKDSADDTLALSIDFIKNYFADRNFPWDLRPLDAAGPETGGQRPPSSTKPAASSDTSMEAPPDGYYRLLLKENKHYVDAAYCTTRLVLSPAPSDYAEGACELFRFVPAGGGWSRLQMMSGGKYLSAARCSTNVSLAEISGAEDGACQLWRLVPAGGGWSRLQLKHGQGYLDGCSPQISVRPESGAEDGACQLWRLVPN